MGNSLQEIISVIEKRLKRSLDPVEIQVIKKWVEVDCYPVEYILYSIPKTEFTLSYLDGVLKRNVNKPMALSNTPCPKSVALLDFWNMLK